MAVKRTIREVRALKQGIVRNPGGKRTQEIVIVKPMIDPSQFIGELNRAGTFHVKLLKIIESDGKRYWKVETREKKIGIVPESDVQYAAMVSPVEVNDCFLMAAVVSRQSATTIKGEPQTFFRDIEIQKNYGTPTKGK